MTCPVVFSRSVTVDLQQLDILLLFLKFDRARNRQTLEYTGYLQLYAFIQNLICQLETTIRI
jgi:hypothetical protein